MPSADQSQSVQEVYAGAQSGGMRIAGISDVEVTDALEGSKDNPVKVGDRVKVTVRVAEDGRLLPRREDAKPTDPPAVSLLIIESTPSTLFDTDGNPHTVFVAHARLVDVATTRVVDTGRSGPTTEEAAALQAGRPYHEYMNDPEYVDTSMSSEAQTRQDAVEQAVGRIDLSKAGSSSKGKKSKVIAAAAATVVVLGVGGIALSNSGDAPETNAAPSQSEEPDESAQASAEPTDAAPTEAAAPDIATELGLVDGGTLRLEGMFEPGRCGGSPFQSELVLSDEGDHIGLAQIQPGGVRQESSGYPLTDGTTLVLFDHGDNYDEMYIIQPGSQAGSLVGVNFYGDEGTIPDVDALPQLEDLLAANGFARDVIDGGPPRNRFLESSPFPGPPSDYCDLDLILTY